MTPIDIRRGVRVTLLILAVALATSSLACGGKDTSEGTAPKAPLDAVSASGPGSVTVASSVIRGQNGRVLLVFATQEGRGPLARACIRITSDSFSVSAGEMTEMPAGNDPCGESNQVTTFPEGKYTITAGVYAPPGQTPEKQVTQTVEVKGDIQVVLDGNALSR